MIVMYPILTFSNTEKLSKILKSDITIVPKGNGL